MIAGNRRHTGQRYEKMAQSWLERRGLRALAHNYSCRLGELDLIMQDAAQLVIIEVKYRGKNAWVSGPESVTPAKQSRIIRAAQHFLQHHPGLLEQPVRFDLVSICDSQQGQKIDWIRDAFQPRL